jgi:hypothetical protein
MDQDLKDFVGSLTRVVLPIVFAVASTAFVTIPATLGYVPGDAVVARAAADAHMTCCEPSEPGSPRGTGVRRHA